MTDHTITNINVTQTNKVNYFEYTCRRQAINGAKANAPDKDAHKKTGQKAPLEWRSTIFL